ncbi:MAG TPA: substrate-binding domain-containing protein, partial [Verrucomicrobiae bacterium]
TPKMRPSGRFPARPRVAILVDTSTSWGRRVVKGINNYSLKHQAWQLFVEARGLEEQLRIPPGWQGDGVIARVSNESLAAELRASRLPVVNVSGIDLAGAGFPRVITDVDALARLAMQHFLNRGFHHFAYFSLWGLSYVAAQQRAFIAATQQAGYDCDVYGVRSHIGAEPDWNLDSAKLQTWLQALPKPIGILTWNADSSRQLVYACELAGLQVPEEVAILSGSDDDLLCEVSHIPISAILVAAEQIGYQAAELLHRQLRKIGLPPQPICLKPTGIVTRQSTETMAIRDRALVKALSFIREHADQSIHVDAVTRHAGISRRGLERKFGQVLGRTPAAEIRRVHLERAKMLLLETDLPIPEVASGSGFGSPEYLTYVFRTELKQTPLKYRQWLRGK